MLINPSRFGQSSYSISAGCALPVTFRSAFNTAKNEALLHVMPDNREQEIRARLAFYQEAGVDALLDEKPVDRLADPPPAETRISNTVVARPSSRRDPEILQPTRGVPPRRQELKTGVAASPPPSPEAAVMAAREAAKTAASLDDLRAILLRFEGCALRMTATQLVFADGNPQARVMFVGEAPGREEDIQGLPFVGRSGQLLDRMMASIGIDRKSAYVANIVPWRPPGNRTPTPQESAICLPFIRRQIELADPDVLVCLGGPSAQTLLSLKEGILKSRGRWFNYQTGAREIRALATLHPAYLLRQPLQKRLAWRDFLAIKKALTGG
jgi:uracil-DNA glycosylase